MSSSNTSSADVNTLNYITIMFVQVWSYSLICLGTIGHSLNIYVFTRPIFCSNPCVIYFLASAISGYFVAVVNTPLRLIQLIYNIDAFGYSYASCKILSFITYWARVLAYWFIVLACIDRFLCSSRSTAMRAWSNRRIAFRAIPLVTVAGGLVYLYVPILFEIKQAARRCPSVQGISPLFNGIWTLVIFSMGPSVAMLIFGLLTIRNVHSSIRQVAPQNINTQNQSGPPQPPQEQLQRQRTIDRQLIRMMIVQFIYFSSFSTPSVINWLYTTLRPAVVSTALQSAKDNLVANITAFLSLTCACTSFYLFTLSSQLFRRELIYLFKNQWRTQQQIITNTIRSRARN